MNYIDIEQQNELYAKSLHGYYRTCVIQWQMGGATILQSLELSDEALKKSIALQCGQKWDGGYNDLFPLAAQMRKYISDKQFEALQHGFRYTLNGSDDVEELQLHISIQSKDSWMFGYPYKMLDIATAFMTPYAYTYGNKFGHSTVQEYIDSLPFTFRQIKLMAMQFKQDMLYIISNAPKLSHSILLYRGIHHVDSIQASRALVSTSLSVVESLKYVYADNEDFDLVDIRLEHCAKLKKSKQCDLILFKGMCCFMQIKVPKNTPIFMITSYLFQKPSQRDEKEVILDFTFVQPKANHLVYNDPNKPNQLILTSLKKHMNISVFDYTA